MIRRHVFSTLFRRVPGPAGLPKPAGRITAGAVLAVTTLTVAGAPAGAATTGAPAAVTVSGNQLLVSGAPARLLGVDRSGTEYACVQGWGIFDGPSDGASIAAMASWHISDRVLPAVGGWRLRAGPERRAGPAGRRR